MRSIFNEPAHLGYFLNIILLINVFQKKYMRIKIMSVILCLGVLLTFSYSAIITAGIILVMKSIHTINRTRKLSYQWVGIGFSVALVVIYLFRTVIYEALYLRTVDIFAGRDQSFIDRIFGSWQYLNADNFILGKGIGRTPTIFNNYAYVFTDMGVVGFIVFFAFSVFIIINHFPAGIIYVLLNFQRGGYLGPSFWLLNLIYMIYFIPYYLNIYSTLKLKQKDR